MSTMNYIVTRGDRDPLAKTFHCQMAPRPALFVAIYVWKLGEEYHRWVSEVQEPQKSAERDGCVWEPWCAWSRTVWLLLKLRHCNAAVRRCNLQTSPRHSEYQFNECRVEITPALPLILPRWSYYITEPQEHYTLYNSIANVDNLSRGLYLFLLLLHEYLA